MPHDPSEPLTPERQLEQWQKGNSLCPNTHGECCPDFSCCNRKLLASQEVRDAYVAGTQEGRERLLGQFLGALGESIGADVHIAGTQGG